MISMLLTQLYETVAVGTKLGPWGLSRTSRAPKRPFWASGDTYMVTGWAKMTGYYVLYTESALRSFEAFHTGSVAPFISVGMWAGPKISILALWKFLHEYPRQNLFHHNNWSKNNILGQFQPNRRVCFFKRWPFVHTHFWPFLTNFGIFWPVFGPWNLKCTKLNHLGAKCTKFFGKICTVA